MESKTKCFIWKGNPRIITYENPKKLNENPEIIQIMKDHPHLCASNTLMQGLVEKYERKSFSVITSVEDFVDALFQGKLSNPANDLQLFLDISKEIDKLSDEVDRSEDIKRAYTLNRKDVVDAVKLLILSDFDDTSMKKYSDEQTVFFESIYKNLKPKYVNLLKGIVDGVSTNSIRDTLKKVTVNEINYQFKDNGKYFLNTSEASSYLSGIIDEKEKNEAWLIKKAEQYLSVIRDLDKCDYSTVVIHGVSRFRPEIMKMIETLDGIGVNIIFLINYVDNLDCIYNMWDQVYSWTGCAMENVGPLNMSSGNEIGKRIATVCKGERVKGNCYAILKEYEYLTDFTDGYVRRKYIEAEKKYKSAALSKMNVQFYAVNPDPANDILRNYFPDQFSEKPFMSYPVGRFVSGIYSMWDFSEMKMRVNFDELIECAVVRIGHNNDRMGELIRKIRTYFKDLEYVDDILDRSGKLKNQIDQIKKGNNRFLSYLSFFSVSCEEIDEFCEYVKNIEKISMQIFAEANDDSIDYREHFHNTMRIVSDYSLDSEVTSEKEKELILMLLKSISVPGDERVTGAAKELENALRFYLSAKKENKGSNWIVRGFDQLDGAPFLCEKTQKTYEFALLSMSNMTHKGTEFIPWPLSEDLIDMGSISSVYFAQLKKSVETRSDYLLYYLFYGSFFSNAGMQFSYVKEENNVKQRPYFVLQMINAVDERKKRKKRASSSNDCKTNTPPIEISVEASERERRLFSICAYKFFLASLMKENICYTNEYHINYFIENEATWMFSKICNYDRSKRETAIDSFMNTIAQMYPYLDKLELMDIREYILSNFLNNPPTRDYLEKKRDFLIAKWEDYSTGQNYMKYDGTKEDIREYLMNEGIYPPNGKWPHVKICQECNFNNICMKYYFDKVSDS